MSDELICPHRAIGVCEDCRTAWLRAANDNLTARLIRAEAKNALLHDSHRRALIELAEWQRMHAALRAALVEADSFAFSIGVDLANGKLYYVGRDLRRAQSLISAALATPSRSGRSMAECEKPDGHNWQTLTRHPDPVPGVLANAICEHCGDSTHLDLRTDEEIEISRLRAETAALRAALEQIKWRAEMMDRDVSAAGGPRVESDFTLISRTALEAASSEGRQAGEGA